MHFSFKSVVLVANTEKNLLRSQTYFFAVYWSKKNQRKSMEET